MQVRSISYPETSKYLFIAMLFTVIYFFNIPFNIFKLYTCATPVISVTVYNVFCCCCCSLWYLRLFICVCCLGRWMKRQDARVSLLIDINPCAKSVVDEFCKTLTAASFAGFEVTLVCECVYVLLSCEGAHVLVQCVYTHLTSASLKIVFL